MPQYSIRMNGRIVADVTAASEADAAARYNAARTRDGSEPEIRRDNPGWRSGKATVKITASDPADADHFGRPDGTPMA